MSACPYTNHSASDVIALAVMVSSFRAKMDDRRIRRRQSRSPGNVPGHPRTRARAQGCQDRLEHWTFNQMSLVRRYRNCFYSKDGAHPSISFRGQSSREPRRRLEMRSRKNHATVMNDDHDRHLPGNRRMLSLQGNRLVLLGISEMCGSPFSWPWNLWDSMCRRLPLAELDRP